MESSFEAFGYKPHTAQRRIHDAERTNRFIVADCGRRFGKSQLGGRRLGVKALESRFIKGLSKTGKRAEYWIVGPEYSDGEKEFRVLYDTMSKLGAQFDRPGTYYSLESGQMDLSMYDGQFQVHVKSSKYPTSLVGESLMGVIFAEAAKVKPVIWPKYIRPMLSDYRGWAEFTSTPEGQNWFYQLYRLGQDPNNKEWWSIKAPSWANDVLFPLGFDDPEIQSMRAGMTEEKFKQEIGAEFTEFVGRVYKNFDEEENVVDLAYNPKLPLYMCADYGYTNPNVVLWVQVGVWGDVYVIAEYYQHQRRPDEMLRDIQSDPRLAALARASTTLYGDPEDPAATDLLCEKLQLRKGNNTGGLLQTRINLIRKRLEPQPLELPDGHPEKKTRLWFDRSCTFTIQDFNNYRYPETRAEAEHSKAQPRAEAENPLKVDDHGPEALSRFFGGYFNDEKPKRRARSSMAQMTSG